MHLGVRTSGAGGLWITDREGTRVLKLNQSQDGSGRITVLTAEGEEAGAGP